MTGKASDTKGPTAWQKSKIGVLPKTVVVGFGKIIVSMALGFVTALGFLMMILMLSIGAKVGLPGPMGDRFCGILSILAYLQAPITSVFVTLALLRQEKETAQ